MRSTAPDPLGAGDADFRSWSRESVPGGHWVMRSSAPQGRRPSGPGTGSSVRRHHGGGSVMRCSAPDSLGAGDADFRSWSRVPAPGVPSVMRFSAPEGPSPAGQGKGSSVPKEASKNVGLAQTHEYAETAFPFNDFVPCCGEDGPSLSDLPARLYGWLLADTSPLASLFDFSSITTTPSPQTRAAAKELLPLPLAEPSWKSGSSATQREPYYI